MQLVSTIHPTETISFTDAVTRGLPSDGGLYLPTPSSLRPLPATFWKELPNLDRTAVCTAVAEHLFGKTLDGMSVADLVSEAVISDAPLVPVTERITALELFHGPTAAFKDFGARFLAAVTTRIAASQGRILTILVATSGDTGGAVAHSFWQRAGVQVVVLYPAGQVSPIQERQFAALGGNVHALRVAGSFDSCQAMVKRALAASQYRESLGLTSANSINVARLLPQIFYYFLASQQWISTQQGISAQQRLSAHGGPFVCAVPCGNFGNLTAGLYAQKLGAPISRFIAATNANSTVPDFLAGKSYQPRPSVPTISNAMDIGDPSNMPRIMALFGNDPEAVRAALTGQAVSDDETRETMRSVLKDHSYLLDPHGAVSFRALDDHLKPDEHGIFLHTAHPAKFSEVIRDTLGIEPPIPPQLAEIMHRPINARSIAPESLALEEFLRELAEK